VNQFANKEGLLCPRRHRECLIFLCPDLHGIRKFVLTPLCGSDASGKPQKKAAAGSDPMASAAKKVVSPESDVDASDSDKPTNSSKKSRSARSGKCKAAVDTSDDDIMDPLCDKTYRDKALNEFLENIKDNHGPAAELM
jgi:hypothetical protein